LEIYRGSMRQSSLIEIHEFDDFPSERRSWKIALVDF